MDNKILLENIKIFLKYIAMYYNENIPETFKEIPNIQDEIDNLYNFLSQVNPNFPQKFVLYRGYYAYYYHQGKIIDVKRCIELKNTKMFYKFNGSSIWLMSMSNSFSDLLNGRLLDIGLTNINTQENSLSVRYPFDLIKGKIDTATTTN